MNFLQAFALNVALSAIAGTLKGVPEQRLNEWLVRLGLAFGPAGLRHFSELTIAERDALLRRVPVLALNHSDWPKPFQWVPRRWTCWVGKAPTLADVIIGEVSEMKPIPNNGEWYVLRGYMAASTVDGVHNRLGWRYDDVDDYFEFPSLTVKWFK